MASQAWTDEAIDRQLGNLYYGLGDPASYSGTEQLYARAMELQIPGITRERVRKFLTEQATYQLHKPAHRKFTHNQTVVGHRDEQWQADLAVMNNLAHDNKGYRYILTCIDVLSRYAWAVPVRTKGTKDMLAAMELLFDEAWPRKPQRLQTDRGVEFYNAAVRRFLREQNVELFSTNSPFKCALVERFNRTLKTMLYKYFTAHKTRRWYDVLDSMVTAYNQRPNRTIGAPPATVLTEDDDRRVWRRVYYDSKQAQLRRADLHPRNADNTANAGDRVRISLTKGHFDKGYMPNWGRQHLVVKQVVPPNRGGRPRPVFRLADTEGEDMNGQYYPEEVQRVPERLHNTFEVERILRRRAADGGQTETLVKFKGWPEKFNRWITEAELVQYQKPPRMQQEQPWRPTQP
jgi:transposase InsO family protein